MIWHLFAVLIMAVCMGGAAFGLRRLTRGKVPKWMIPVAAAAGMMGYLAYYDYSWYAFKLSQLPPGTTVIAEKRDQSFLKPWRYAYPAVSAFTILDGKFSSKLQDHQVLVDVEAMVAAERAEKREAADVSRVRDAYEANSRLQQLTVAAYRALAKARWRSPWTVADATASDTSRLASEIADLICRDLVVD